MTRGTHQYQFVVEPFLYQYIRVLWLDLGKRQIGQAGGKTGVDAAAVSHPGVNAVVREGIGERQQQIGEQVLADRLGNRQTQPVAPGLQLIQVTQQLHLVIHDQTRKGVDALSRGGQAQAPRFAHHQLDIETALEGSQTLGHRRLADVQRAPGLGNAAAFHDLPQSRQRLQVGKPFIFHIGMLAFLDSLAMDRQIPHNMERLRVADGHQPLSQRLTTAGTDFQYGILTATPGTAWALLGGRLHTSAGRGIGMRLGRSTKR